MQLHCLLPAAFRLCFLPILPVLSRTAFARRYDLCLCIGHCNRHLADCDGSIGFATSLGNPAYDDLHCRRDRFTGARALPFVWWANPSSYAGKTCRGESSTRVALVKLNHSPLSSRKKSCMNFFGPCDTLEVQTDSKDVLM